MISSVLPWYQALIMGLLQGVTELFPVSSLGHAVLFPSIFGWHEMARAQSQPESYFLAFLVALHVGTAFGLIAFYFSTWCKLFAGLFTQLTKPNTSLVNKLNPLDSGSDSRYRLLFLIGLGTIPVGLVGVAFEHKLRTVFAVPRYAAIFLTLNGVVMLLGEWLRRSAGRRSRNVKLAELSPVSAGLIGSAQIAALFAGISRSGVAMVASLIRGLDHEDAANFSFLLATPVILLAGLYKIPDFLGPLGDGIRAQAFAGAVVAGIAAYFSVRFLSKWFHSHTLWPFGIYCLLAGGACIIHFA